ncbi:PAS domain-containing protein [Pedobacter psychrodurus]|uniref:PAS domain-containing protein n=1 Tax=Pedobacter psychrodurus TaxID=2530456 RepID=A0A4R0Q5E3_9SPHI|nr:CheR family methyltransferase [Pedobacter psychrodurus]TCD26542.1 PAS domain-containing protein [Pedobacter psychrodurus]
MKKKVAERKGKLSPVAQLQQKANGFLIVGIGASAGGIQAMQEFFRNVPEGSNMAYVVILHLSPDHDSQLAAVLQQETQIPVSQVTVKTIIKPDHIYVIPPDRHLKIEGDSIAVMPNIHIEERRAPVDIFFRTLADQHGPRAISVVLSGTGANGSMGLKRIKERGGATYVQNPREAEFNEMPRNAIATDLVDEVLNVGEIPARIIAYRDSMGTVQIIEEPEKRPEPQQQALRDIFTQLRVRTGHDFSNYKRPTLLRRIERRINVHNLPDLPSYTAFLHGNPDETNALLKDLLISVTNFFRDSKAFECIEQDVVPGIFAGKTSEDQVRIWVAGCATGEEAYSLAMLCAEHALRTFDAPKVQIFATDIDESAITTAREGLYTLNDAADVSQDRLRRFFTRDGDGYRVRREIREMVLFAHHNFLKDPPFSKLDLVACRNVLIYLNGTAQERVTETFHFALRPKGYLFLGTSESVDGASDLYSIYNRDNHIFQAREVSSRSYPIPESVPQFHFLRNDPLQKPDERENWTQRISFGDLHQKMLEQYAPPSVVINSEYEIVHMSEKAGRYFEFSGGEPTQNLLKLIRPEIRLELRSALYQAVQNKTVVEARNIKVSGEVEPLSLDIQVRPVLEDGDTMKGFILVIFKPAQEPFQEGTTVKMASDESLARQLEEELIRLKIQLRSSIEQHEYQAEELKASNEELQAMNEELRSAAEELETSKEELQSINEELRTVNQELKVKIDETGVTSNNLQNLVNSANVGTIFLDRSFAIRLFTPAIQDIFNLKTGDYGRPVTDITNKLQYSGLLQDAEAVLEKLTVVEREVTTSDNRYFMMRLLPYRTAEDRINGVVITFFDITGRKESEEALRISEEKYRLALEKEVADRTRELRENYALLQTIYDTTLIGMSVFAPITDAQGKITDFHIVSANKKMELAYGHKGLVGKLFSGLFPGKGQLGIFDLMVKTFETGMPVQIEQKYIHEGVDMWYSTMFVKGEDLLVSTSLDISERKILEDKRLRAFALLQQSEELAGIGSWDYDLMNGNFTCSQRMYYLFNLEVGKELSPDIYLHYASKECRPTAEKIVEHIRSGDEDFEETIELMIEGMIKAVHLKATVIRDEEGNPVRMLGVDMDITAMREAERKLRDMENQQQQEIFRITLSTQEEERRRISESLHNGVGQLLYGTRLAINHLTVDMATAKPDRFNESKAYTEKLLSDSINDIRRISHELMPTVLAEFGLDAAIKDVCDQLQDGVRFDCQITLGDIKLDNYIELAVFRTVQELMINVVKHARATSAEVEVKVDGGSILISVHDNGQGMTATTPSKSGIGLLSIRNKVELLKGKLDINSVDGKGTVIEVKLPIEFDGA